jgi:hypothetical protein
MGLYTDKCAIDLVRVKKEGFCALYMVDRKMSFVDKLSVGGCGFCCACNSQLSRNCA